MHTTSDAVKQQIRESLGLAPQPEPKPTVPVEGHVCEFPFWSFSDKRSRVQRLRINYADHTFLEIVAPLGMPGPLFPGYLDTILLYGDGDLMTGSALHLSLYQILRTLRIAPSGQAYSRLVRDMRRAMSLILSTDRFIDPVTRRRTSVGHFHLLDTLWIAKYRQGVSTFTFATLFLESYRAGYIKRLDADFCLYLDRDGEALARFLYGHIAKRMGTQGYYSREFLGFVQDVGLGYIAGLVPKRRNEKIKQTLLPALTLLQGKAFHRYEIDARGVITFLP